MIDFDTNIELSWKFILAGLVSIAGYFIPIRDILHLMFLFFMIDIAVGFWANRRKSNVKFNPMIVWQKTVPRMILSSLLIILLFMWDDVSHQEYINSANLAGWFFNGLLLISITENAYYITEWKVFGSLTWVIRDKIQSKTNVNIDTQHETDH